MRRHSCQRRSRCCAHFSTACFGMAPDAGGHFGGTMFFSPRRALPQKKSATTSHRTRRTASWRLEIELLEDRCLLTTYVVTTLADVVNDTNPGELSFRDAITAINPQSPSGNAPAGTSSNEIDFAIGSTGSQQIITLYSPLPPILNQVVINGFTQGGAGYSGPPLIDISADGAS